MPTDVTVSALKGLISEGTLGTLLVLALVAIWWLAKKLGECQEQLVKNGAATAVAVEKATTAITDVRVALDNRHGHFERLGGKQDEAARELSGVSRELEKLTSAIEELRRETRK